MLLDVFGGERHHQMFNSIPWKDLNLALISLIEVAQDRAKPEGDFLHWR